MTALRAVLPVVLLLAACGAGDDRRRPAPGALHDAAARGDRREVERLLAAGADVDARGPGGRTAVTAAAAGRHPDVVRVLVDAGADVDLQADDRSNALLVCGETGDVAVLREVLRADPDPARTNRFGGTALIPAADRGHVEMVRALLDATRIDVDHVNELGWTALLEAVLLGDGGPAHQEIVALLLDAGATPDLPDRDGTTPREHAEQLGHEAIARALRRAAP